MIYITVIIKKDFAFYLWIYLIYRKMQHLGHIQMTPWHKSLNLGGKSDLSYWRGKFMMFL